VTDQATCAVPSVSTAIDALWAFESDVRVIGGGWLGAAAGTAALAGIANAPSNAVTSNTVRKALNDASRPTYDGSLPVRNRQFSLDRAFFMALGEPN